MTYTAVTLIDGDPVPAEVINDISAEVASQAGQARLYSRKTADQAYTSTSYVADTALTLSGFPTNSEWEIYVHLLLKASSSTNGQLKTDFTMPAGSNVDNFQFQSQSPVNYNVPAANAAISGWLINTSNLPGWLRGIFVVGSTSGSLTLRAGQVSASGASSIISAGSYIVARQVL